MRKNKKHYRDLVKKHYKEEAQKHGTALTSTMLDLNTRRLEIQNIISYLKDGDKCLEVGCGNGAASIEISKIKKLDLTCIDFSSDLIALANKQSVRGINGNIRFRKEDILNLKFKKVFDVVFTERCIINLLKWDDQKLALRNMVSVLKKGGRLILLEAYKGGLEKLNKAREEIGLESIPPAYHNLHLEKNSVIKYLEKCGLKFIEENNFLSSYYFGSRVLYPALAKVGRKNITYNSSFGNFFSLAPPYGNYAHIKTLLFKKTI